MKVLILRFINYIDSTKESNPRLFKILYILLWFIAPIEMACIKLGIFGYKKIKEHNKPNLEELR